MSEMKLEKLSEPIDITEIDFRVQSGFKNKYQGVVQCIVLAYKDARVDMNRLDKVVGMDYWQNKYKRDSQGVLQCGIGIKPNGEWIWKWSNGVPSNQDAQKGEYSDALKRAGFVWGIGRHLYNFPQIFVTLNDNEFEEQSGKIKPKIYPNQWTWTGDWNKESGTYENVKAKYRGKIRFDQNGKGDYKPVARLSNDELIDEIFKCKTAPDLSNLKKDYLNQFKDPVVKESALKHFEDLKNVRNDGTKRT